MSGTLRTQLRGNHGFLQVASQPRVHTQVCELPSLPTREKNRFRDWSPGRSQEQERASLSPSSPQPNLARTALDWVHWTHEAGGFLEEVEFD